MFRLQGSEPDGKGPPAPRPGRFEQLPRPRRTGRLGLSQSLLAVSAASSGPSSSGPISSGANENFFETAAGAGMGFDGLIKKRKCPFVSIDFTKF